MNDLDALLNARGVSENLGANIITGVFNRLGSHAAFALGDGSLRLSDGKGWSRINAHEGAVLALAPDSTVSGFLSGGDDGKLQRVSIEGSLTEIASFGMKWVDNIASFAHPKSGL
ncbi:MAG: hypothetical protein B7W99_02580, partial [Rhodospirillales bacterium 20-58-10]